MKTITSFIAAVFCLATRMVTANTSNATVLSADTTLRQALQLFDRIVNGSQLNKLERVIKSRLEGVNIGYETYKFLANIKAVNVDISNSCSFLKLNDAIDIQPIMDLPDEDFFSFFKNLINKIHERTKAISDMPGRTRGMAAVKNWLVLQRAGSAATEFYDNFNEQAPYFCYRELLVRPGNLLKLKALFDNYNKVKLEAEKAKAKTESAAAPSQEPRGTDETGSGIVTPTTSGSTIDRPSNNGETPTDPKPTSPTHTIGSNADEPSSPSTETNPTSETSDGNQPTSAVISAPSTTESTTTESTSTNPAVPNAQDPSATGGEATGTPSTPAPATGETTAPAEQPTQDATSNTSGSSAPATGETTAPAEQPTQDATSNTSGSSAPATGESAQQQSAPQGENLKPAPTGSSASFNGLAVAVLSVLVVSSI